jgi:uncharacterized protein (TIGR02118 family)
MAGAKIMVMYPAPKDLAEFERAYHDEHIPMAAAAFGAAGAVKAVLSKAIGAPSGAPPFHRIAEIHFKSLADLQACAASRGGQDALAHAAKISSGGPPVVIIAEEDVVTF